MESWEARRREDWVILSIGIFIGSSFGLLLGVGFTLLAASQHWLVFP